MGQALGNVLPIAVAIAIFPIPIIASVLILGSSGGRLRALVFALAWCVGLAAIGAVVLVLAGGLDASDSGEPATWVSVLLVCLGAALLALAAKQWRTRPRAGAETPLPGWMRTLDHLTTAKAGGAGFALSALNPKNVLLTAAAAAEIAEVGLAAREQAVVLLVFVLAASIGVLTPLVVSLVLGDRSRQPLDWLRSWMARHNAVIMTLLFVLIGAKLVANGITGLSG